MTNPFKREPLPMQDSRPKSEQGLFFKYRVTRTDGSSKPGGKHHECEYFVLDVAHDKFARAALTAYADACQSEFPNLAKDLRERHDL